MPKNKIRRIESLEESLSKFLGDILDERQVLFFKRENDKLSNSNFGCSSTGNSRNFKTNSQNYARVFSDIMRIGY
jgi:hypothetical protein